MLELSLREALALHHHYIGTEHLMLGLVRQDDSIVGGAMRAADVGTSTLRDDVRQAVRRAAS